MASTARTTSDTPARDTTLAPPARRVGRILSWVFLITLAALLAISNPILVNLQPRFDLTLLIPAAGVILAALGARRGWPLLIWPGAAVIWLGIAACITTQSTAIGTAPALVWGERGIVLVGAALIWFLLLGLPAWVQRATLAAALPTLIIFAVLWITAPTVVRTAGFYWLAADARGRLYATDIDNGSIWVFDWNGNVSGQIWPRRAAPGSPGPGIQPAGMGSEFTQQIARTTPKDLPLDRTFHTCGMAVDPENYLYVLDTGLSRIQQFNPDGHLRATWPLPQTYISAPGCLAADATRLYIADNRGIILVYDHAGAQQTEWKLSGPSRDLAVGWDGRLYVLHDASVEVLEIAGGRHLLEWDLPPGIGTVPYDMILARRNGEILINNNLTAQVLRYRPTGEALPALGKPGTAPGEFGVPAGLTEDAESRLYISDAAYRVIQRFSPTYQVEAVWSVPEEEKDEAERRR